MQSFTVGSRRQELTEDSVSLSLAGAFPGTRDTVAAQERASLENENTEELL